FITLRTVLLDLHSVERRVNGLAIVKRVHILARADIRIRCNVAWCISSRNRIASLFNDFRSRMNERVTS
ncbi:hypothetical protein AIZ15_24465, partial [Salmonella enterica subsp. enterica serovar Typhimurium]